MLPDEVSDIVARQKQAGISIVNDGEISKPGFAKYISTRVEGVGGEADMWTFADLEAVPDLKAAQFGTEAAEHIKCPPPSASCATADTTSCSRISRTSSGPRS
jgi:5-methyltetrahydropteroyltriglutamate--homocysteine methyltransferase